MRILYMGTPDFAVAPLQKLIEYGFDIVGVVTQPDKPQGRHMTLTPSPVKVAATGHGISVYTPEKLKNGELSGILSELDPELIVVVAYGKILPPYVLGYPRLGCINLHGSLLPKYRGAAPMQRTVINGEKYFGATVMYMNEGCDTGDMIEKISFPLTDSMNFGDVHDVLSEKGGELLAGCVGKLDKEGTLPREKQNGDESSYAAKIENSDMLLDFSSTAREIHNRIRGLSPAPLSYCILNGKKIKIVQSAIIEEASFSDEPGRIVEAEKNGITVQCGRGRLNIISLIPEGKKMMDASSFINGRGCSVGDIFLSR